MANQKKFNMEMDAYLKSRRRRQEDKGLSPFKGVKIEKGRNAPEVYDDEDVEVEYREPGFFARFFSFNRKQMIEQATEDLSPEQKKKLEQMQAEVEGIEEEIDELEEMEHELEVQRVSLIDKLMSFLGFGSDMNDVDDYIEPPAEDVDRYLMDEDVKEVLKIAHSWIEKLPAKQKKEFRDSEDFDKYKEILRRYGLIREKK